MPRYKITDPETGRSLMVTGDSAPDEDDIADLFGDSNDSVSPQAGANQASSQPDAGGGFMAGLVKTALPGFSAAVRELPGKLAQPRTPQNIGPMGIAPEVGQTAVALAGDIYGGLSRLAGSLIPSKTTRGSVDGRMRTTTESLQNPQTSLTTGIQEDIGNSELPGPVKSVAQFAVGAAEGALTGGVGGLVKKASGEARQAAGAGLVKTGDALQNWRLGVLPSDASKGFVTKVVRQHGYHKMPVADAYADMQKRFAGLGTARDAELLKGPKIDINSIFDDVGAKIDNPAFSQSNFTKIKDMRKALEKYKADLRDVMGTGRKPVAEMSDLEEIRAGLASGELKYTSVDGKPTIAYAKPEQAGFQAADMIAANRMKMAMGDELDVQHFQGKAMKNPDAVPRAEIAGMLYAAMKKRIDFFGSDDIRKINREFSDLIPLRSVFRRNLDRSELERLDPAFANQITSLGGLKRAALRGASGPISRAATAAGEALGAPVGSTGDLVKEGAVRSGMLRGFLSPGQDHGQGQP